MENTNKIYTVNGATEPETVRDSIERFRGEWAFLSNFFEQSIEVEGETYPTAEHAFQALKTRESAERYHVQTAPTPAAAKKRGRKVTLRDDWSTARFAVMEQVLRVKFQNPELRAKLLLTGDRTLIEGNTWRDTTWGAVREKNGGWKGRNELGKLLMKLRDELRAQPPPSGEERQTMAYNTATTGDGSRAELIATAVETRTRAYAPYSKYQVGAAVQMGDGRIVGGCNIENASYGLCNCAERTALFRALAEGAPPVLLAVAVATSDGGTPCGACRQVLSEFAPKNGTPVPVYLLDNAGDVVREITLAELFPLPFAL